MSKPAVATVLSLAAAISAGAARAADPAPVIAAERAFAARAAEVGVAPSFLAFMTAEATTFGPNAPVNARAFYLARPKGKAPNEGGPLLAWWPTFAGLASSGDIGFTSGPVSVNHKPAGGSYFTVWVRQSDGGFKWVFDGGVTADQTGEPPQGAEPTVLPPGDPRPMRPAKAWAQVAAAEAELARRAETDSATATTVALWTGARVQGSSSPPATRLDAIARELATRARVIAFRPIGGGAARAGDLVWTWGDASWTGGAAHYVRVWQRRGGRWRIVFDEFV